MIDQDDTLQCHEHPFLTVDVVLLSIGKSQGQSKKHHKNAAVDLSLQVLLGKRDKPPYRNLWSLPGTFVHIDEDLEDSVHRLLKEKLDVTQWPHIEQLYTFGSITRDPRDRIVSVSYIALLPDTTSLLMQPGYGMKELLWFDIDHRGKDTKEFILHSDKDILESSKLAFDHQEIIACAISRIANKVEYTAIAFSFLPPLFTLGQVQNIYECLLHKHMDKANFRKFIRNFVLPTDQREENVGHRPGKLYKLNPDWQNTFWR